MSEVHRLVLQLVGHWSPKAHIHGFHHWWSHPLQTSTLFPAGAWNSECSPRCQTIPGNFPFPLYLPTHTHTHTFQQVFIKPWLRIQGWDVLRPPFASQEEGCRTEYRWGAASSVRFFQKTCFLSGGCLGLTPRIWHGGTCTRGMGLSSTSMLLYFALLFPKAHIMFYHSQ